MKKEFQGLKEDLEAGKHMESPRSTPRHYQIGKHKAVMTYMDSGFKNSHPSTIYCLSNLINADKKQKYPNG